MVHSGMDGIEPKYAVDVTLYSYLGHHSTRDVAPNIAVVTTVVLVATVVTTLLSLEKEGTDGY